MYRPRLLPTVAFALLLAASAALAQPAPPPPKLEPIPEIPLPPGVTDDSELEPQVTITKKDGETVEEARVSGMIVWIKVTPKHGRPYFLIPDGNGTTFIRRDSLDSGLKVPLWVLFSW